MDKIDSAILSELEQGIPLIYEPFNQIADKLGISKEELFERLTKLKKEGVIRRFGASIKPNGVGLTANAVIAFNVPHSRVQEIGAALSAVKEVTHCYERENDPSRWAYNLYIVMHAQKRETIEQKVKQFSNALDISDYVILFSTRDLKKIGTTSNLSTNAHRPSSFTESFSEVNKQ